MAAGFCKVRGERKRGGERGREREREREKKPIIPP
jgi:hypothetical protein